MVCFDLLVKDFFLTTTNSSKIMAYEIKNCSFYLKVLSHDFKYQKLVVFFFTAVSLQRDVPTTSVPGNLHLSMLTGISAMIPMPILL